MRNILFLLILLGHIVDSLAEEGELNFEDRFGFDPELVAYFVDNQDTIELLRATARDSGAPSAERVDALEQMANTFARVSVDVAAELVGDPDAAVASEAVGFLVDMAVMSNHHIDDGAELPPPLVEMHHRHMTSKEALRKALLDSRPEVRIPAASLLASLNDRESLDRLASQNASDAIPDEEVVGYMGLANPTVSAPYLLPHLESGNQEVQSQAIAYLGASPEYQDRIRQDYLLNSAASTPQRIAAAEVLSRSDPEFPDYASALAFEGDLPAKVYDLALASAIEKARNDQATLKMLFDSANRYMKTHAVKLDATQTLMSGFNAE